MRTPTLHALHYSPWTHRALWALEHHRVPFIYREHIPFLGEFALQRRGRAAGVRGRVTVPLLFLDNEVLSDSWDIMRYADRVGTGASLRTDEPEVSEWVNRLEPAYDAARRRVTHKTLESHAALTEAASAVVPRGLATLSTPVAALGARFIAKKYRFDPAASLHPERLVAGLEEIRATLAGGPFLLIRSVRPTSWPHLSSQPFVPMRPSNWALLHKPSGPMKPWQNNSLIWSDGEMDCEGGVHLVIERH